MDTSNLVVGIIIGCIIGYSIGHADVGRLEEQFDDAISQCEIVRDDYLSAVENANEYIEDNNYRISEARDYAWSSYDDMGYILENLEETENADDPGTSCY